ncbi:sulfatase-like hydrolase/transferase [Paractinoplanes lichenicola]|uniref:Sulfatase-like hydrolase/transferase n=1 Tax=Paractinoplanes lichenicola TaxID=2802976 RepID=A0ABS1VY14_9ACTN|nr:sulfatase-like hydrolase/transferase [Actinoplanes lichenicola]MBL7259385.1 sulfatase-like hydrolase/transferase [Actinoplanes lichenicola]
MPVRLRRASAVLLTVLAAALIVAALVVPEAIARPKQGAFLPGAFLRFPIEIILFGAVVFALPARWRRPFAVLFGLGVGVLVILKIANAGFRTVLGRKFDPVVDTPLLRDGYNALTETDGKTTATLYVVGAVLGTVLLMAALVLASLRLSRLVTAFPARRALVGLSAVWLALALSGVALFPNAPVASDSAIALLKSTAKQVPLTIRDERQFASAVSHDPYASVPRADLVSGLRGKDVIIGVVESLGHSSLTDPGMSAILNPALDASAARLAAKGFHARTGWLTSSTYGGGSWLAHGSFQSGLWITSQRRYDGMVSGDRLTLTRAFKDAGWQTAGMEPGNTTDWPESGFYGYDQVFDSRNMGYKGPKMGWSRMPDQFVMNKFQKDVYATRTKPLMAEITLTSSHEPWTHVPQMLPWNAIGDGKVYGPQVADAPARSELWADKVKTRAAYARTLAYSVDALTSWAADHGNKNTVLIMFGDHQPMSIITGPQASHDVPVTIIAQDQAVLDRIASWNWTDGLKPGNAPVWRMDEFRDKFFAAYGTTDGVALSPR